jgi:hypothetical protein
MVGKPETILETIQTGFWEVENAAASATRRIMRKSELEPTRFKLRTPFG